MKTKSHKCLSIGITGGIGSGKSEVCRIFEALGSKVLNADLIARNILNSHVPIKSQIKNVFGAGIFLSNGTLDRPRMAKLIFQNHDLQKKLNKIVHPHVIKFLKNEIESVKKSGRYPLIVVEAALIYEAKAADMFDYIIAVDADEKIRIQRITERDRSSKVEILARIKAQLPPENKVSRADFVIQNSGDKQSLDQNTVFLFKLLQRISSQGFAGGTA